MIEIIPVLDLKDSMAVSGKSGLRDTYQILNSIYGQGENPLMIANSLKLNGADEIYIADLDLLEKDGHNINLIKMISQNNKVILDAGVKNYESFKFFLDFAYKIIIPTETLESLEDLYKIFNTFPKERIVISVDIKDNKIFSKNLDMSIDEFKDVLNDLNPNEIILLDISNVGTQNKFNKELLNNFTEFKDKLILGGGITADELDDLESKGIKKVLIGTSLHSGEITLR
ncbi:HisA/HisF family protein [Methanobrevibacter sp. DSM 116169]|uniref:HisA/HisF family protein n=1 Tax=Methanobrevibacter sp. DSM 116169 TaxID=3242727 RepID=UPI0038FD0422